MAVRGERHVAFIRADTTVEPGWLDELLSRVTSIPNGAAATFSDGIQNGSHVPLLASDARCVLLRLRSFPQHLELRDFGSLDAGVADLLLRALDLRRGTVGVRPLGHLGPARTDAAFEAEHGVSLAAVHDRDLRAIERRLRKKPAFRRGLVSIVTLSWNAPEYTLMALKSIAAHTAEPYEVIVVDNGSGPETLAALQTIDDPHVRIIYNQHNRGFSGGNNDGIAHARGDYVIVLNNDVIVTSHWADDLIDAFRRIPGLGISAPRSNTIVGDQQLPEAGYKTEEEMQAFVTKRRREFLHKGYLTDRAVGFCWCISREVLDVVGALDERYALGNFEDDDYCMRVRAAGYWIYVCDDVFIHHFGSRSFVANKVDYRSTMDENWAKFANKWGFSGPLPAEGYSGVSVHGRGFDPAQHFMPFPPQRKGIAAARAAVVPEAMERDEIVFAVRVRDERDWTPAAQFVKRFAQAFRANDPVRLSIGALGDPDALTVASRVERILERAGVAAAQAGEIDIEDFDSDEEWDARRGAPSWIDVGAIPDRSPSALRKFLSERAR
jgi:GT2 family glycosyltransferase